MLKQEIIDDKYIKTFSDEGFYIFGGNPEGLYEDALDLIELEYEYIETDIPIKEEEESENLE